MLKGVPFHAIYRPVVGPYFARRQRERRLQKAKELQLVEFEMELAFRNKVEREREGM